MAFVSPPESSPATAPDFVAVAIIAAVGALVLLTFRDYGLGWDDFTHAEYGDLLIAYYTSGFQDKRALSFVNLYLYGGGFDMAAALMAKGLGLEIFPARRLLGGLVGLVGLLVTWRLGRRLGGLGPVSPRSCSSRSARCSSGTCS